MKLSILIPSIPERAEKVRALIAELEKQIAFFPVEIICLIDNRKRSIGAKRNDLKSLVKGEYWAFCDDDDWISDDYIVELLKAMESRPDVITFDQISSLDGEPFKVSFGLQNENEPARKESGKYVDIKRKPWHVCAWRTDIVKNCFFSDKMYGEDSDFVDFAHKEALKEVHIDEVLHYYYFSTENTRAI